MQVLRMRTMSSKYRLPLVYAIGLLIVRCSTWTRDYSILHTSPYIDYGTNLAPELIDSPNNTAFLLGAHNILTKSDTDTSIGVFVLDGTIRHRFNPLIESGFTLNGAIKSKIYYYSVSDIKFHLLDEPIMICPDIGLGIGLAKVAWNLDFRVSAILGYPVINDYLYLHLAPRYIALLYPWHVRGTDIGPILHSYTFSTIYGFSVGFSFSKPLESATRGSTLRFEIRPDFSWMFGSEPKLDQIGYSVVQFGCQVGVAF